MEVSEQPGISLRAARERAGWSMIEVVQRTKFPRSIIEALEKDDCTVFSSPTYARSYLFRYAEFLGIDPTPWLDFFGPASFTASRDLLSMIESPLEREPSHVSSGKGSGGSDNLVPTLFLLLLSGGLICAAFSGYASVEKRLGESMANEQPPPPAVAMPESGSALYAAPAQSAPTLPAQVRSEGPAGASGPDAAQPASKAEEPATAPRPIIVDDE